MYKRQVDLTAAVHGVVADHILGEVDAGQAAGKDPGSGVLVYVQNFHAVSQRGGADFAAVAADLAGELCSLQTLEGDGAVCGDVHTDQIAYLVGVGSALIVVRVDVYKRQGVDNTALTVWGFQKVKDETSVASTDNKNLSYGTYALYDDGNDVIAAVVVGESDSISSQVAYVSSNNASSEGYADGTWTWNRDVIINGEKVELTETNDENERVQVE